MFLLSKLNKDILKTVTAASTEEVKQQNILKSQQERGSSLEDPVKLYKLHMKLYKSWSAGDVLEYPGLLLPLQVQIIRQFINAEGSRPPSSVGSILLIF